MGCGSPLKYCRARLVTINDFFAALSEDRDNEHEEAENRRGIEHDEVNVRERCADQRSGSARGSKTIEANRF
jgi:hypothetical protein